MILLLGKAQLFGLYADLLLRSLPAWPISKIVLHIIMKTSKSHSVTDFGLLAKIIFIPETFQISPGSVLPDLGSEPQSLTSDSGTRTLPSSASGPGRDAP